MGPGMTIDLIQKARMMRVIICHSRKEDKTVIVTGNDVIKGVVEIQRSVQAIVGTFKSHT
jgi:phosphotransferase system IIB component